MRKLRAIVSEKDIDAVLRSLGEAGVVQFIDVQNRLESWEGVLDSYEAPAEVLSQCSSVLTRIDRLLKSLELKLEELPIKKAPLPEKSLEEVLSDVERELSDIEDRSRPLIEILALSSNILSRTDRLFKDLMVKPEKLPTEKVSLSEEPPEKILAEAWQELSNIESRSKEIVKILTRFSSILSRMKWLLKILKVRMEEAPIEKLPILKKLPEEEFTEIEQKLPEVEKRSKEIVKALSLYPKILSRIDRLLKRLKVKPEKLPAEKVSIPDILKVFPDILLMVEKPPEEMLEWVQTEIKKRLSDIKGRSKEIGLKKLIESPERSVIEKTLLVSKTIMIELKQRILEVKNDLAKEAARMKMVVVRIKNQLHEVETALAKKVLMIKRVAILEKQSVKTKPEMRIIHEDLLSMREIVRAVKEMAESKAKFGRAATTVYFEAWVPKAHVEKAINKVKEAT